MNLTSGDTRVIRLSSPSVTFAQGQQNAQVTISAARITQSTRVTITATQGGITRSTLVTVLP